MIDASLVEFFGGMVSIPLLVWFARSVKVRTAIWTAAATACGDIIATAATGHGLNLPLSQAPSWLLSIYSTHQNLAHGGLIGVAIGVILAVRLWRNR